MRWRAGELPAEPASQGSSGSGSRSSVPVKNTFIHFSSDDGMQQLGGSVKKSLSDPLALSSSEPPALSSSEEHCSSFKKSFRSHTTDSEGHDAGSPTANPNPEGGPQWSAGAAGHGDGSCRPCAWHWKPSGCHKGDACRFCHMCEDGKLKSLKRDKARVVRHRKAERQRVRNPPSTDTPPTDDPSDLPAEETPASNLSRRFRKGLTSRAHHTSAGPSGMLNTGATSSGTAAEENSNAAPVEERQPTALKMSL